MLLGDFKICKSPLPKLLSEQSLDLRAKFPVRWKLKDGYSTRNHNRIALNASKILDQALEDRSCEVYIADIKVQFEPGQNYFYPDVVVTCDERDDDPRFVQFPCLIIEVLSPSTEAADRGLKFAQYRRFTALQEYVLVQPDRPVVEVFRRNTQDQWVLSEYGGEDRLQLESVEVEVAVAELYRQIKFEATSTQ
jgi:Uma2 family endonuclease